MLYKKFLIKKDVVFKRVRNEENVCRVCKYHECGAIYIGSRTLRSICYFLVLGTFTTINYNYIPEKIC